MDGCQAAYALEIASAMVYRRAGLRVARHDNG